MEKSATFGGHPVLNDNDTTQHFGGFGHSFGLDDIGLIMSLHKQNQLTLTANFLSFCIKIASQVDFEVKPKSVTPTG